MRTHRTPRTSFLFLSGLLVATQTGCDQPRPRCSIARGDFAAVFTLQQGTGPCATLTSEELSVQAYSAPRSASDPRPDYDKSAIGIQPKSLTTLLASAADPSATSPEDKPYSFGYFATGQASDDGFCVVPSLTVARLRLPDQPARDAMCGPIAAQPATDITYVWSNVRVYTTAGAYGTQFAADLSYTVGSCTAQYRVSAVYPSVSCNATPTPDASEEVPCPAPIAPTPDDGMCAPPSDPSQVGTGLNYDFAVHCDPTLLRCVLNEEPPSLR